MLRDVEFKAAPQECSEKLPVPPALDAVALMQRSGARAFSLPWDRGCLARSFFTKLRGGRDARGPRARGDYLNAHEIAAPNAYPAHTASRQSPTDAAT
jgi:hypothetical protein